MQINPNEVLNRKIIYSTNNDIITNNQEKECQLQQVGIDLRLKENLVLDPHSYKNIEIYEKFDMQDTFGLLIIRSSLSRRGIFMSSGVFDPGFKGIGGVTLYNFQNDFIKLPALFRFCQIICFEANYASIYEGHYNRNNSIESKYV